MKLLTAVTSFNGQKFHFLVNPFVDRPIKMIGSTIKASKKEVLLVVKNI